MLDPASPLSKSISDLFNITLLLGGLVFLLVAGLVGYALLRYRRTGTTPAGEPEQVTGNPPLEIGWTIAPAVLLVVLFIVTVATIGAADPARPAGQEAEIVVVGHQWWWEYRYPGANVRTANELHIPAGRRVLVRVEASDVQHNLWIPRLSRKVDMYPDKPNTLWLQASTPGFYLGACSEYCGTQHAWMLIRVFAQPQAEYDNWLRLQSTPQGSAPAGSVARPAAAAPLQPPGNAARGSQIYLNNTCINCHAITGTTSEAQIGPNLTHLGNRETLGTGIVKNDPQNLARWIKNAKSIKPGVLMPAYQFSDQDLSDLVAFLLEERP